MVISHETHIASGTSAVISRQSGKRTGGAVTQTNLILAGPGNNHLYVAGTGADGGGTAKVGGGNSRGNAGGIGEENNLTARIRASVVVKIDPVTVARGGIHPQNNSI